MAAPAEIRRVHGVPSAGDEGDARDPGRAGHVRVLGGGVAPPHPVGSGRRQHALRRDPARRSGGHGRLRGLDGPDRRGRAAAGAAASARDRAQRRHHGVGLGRPEGLSPRRGLDRPQQPDPQCQRAALRGAGAERRLPARARSRAAHREPGAADSSATRARPSRRRPRCPSPPPTGGTSRSGRAGTTSTTRCSITRGASGSRPRCGRSRTRTSARRARRTRPRSCSRWRDRAGTWPSTTRPRRRSRTSAPASARIT